MSSVGFRRRVQVRTEEDCRQRGVGMMDLRQPAGTFVGLYLQRLGGQVSLAMALFFFSGTLIYVTVLLTNAIAILSEERFLAKSE